MREVPLGEYALPVDALLAAADERTKLLCLLPNNPTGNAFPATDIEPAYPPFQAAWSYSTNYIDFASEPGRVHSHGSTD